MFDMFFGGFETFKRERRNNEKMTQMFRQHGSTFEQQPTGSPTTILFTTDPANLKAAWAMDFNSWGLEESRAWAMAPFSGKGIVTADGHLWQVSRSWLRPVFARKKQPHDLGTFRELFEGFLQAMPEDDNTIDILPLLNRLGHDNACNLLFGENQGALTGEEQAVAKAQKVMSAMKYCDLVVCKRMEIPRWEIFCRDNHFYECCDIVHEWFDEMVQRAQDRADTEKSGDSASNPHPYVWSEALVKENLSADAIREQLINMFVAARGAVSSNIGHMLFLLARHPNCWTKLREEVLISGVLQETDHQKMIVGLKSLKYLRGVINESFRLLPTLGFTERVAMKKATLPKGGGGDCMQPIAINKGDVVVTNFAALHRRKEVFGEDADEFRPERWDNWQPPPWTFIPFGGGPRICIGQDIGLIQIRYALASLAARFEMIETRDPVWEFVENFKLTTASTNGIKIAFRRASTD